MSPIFIGSASSTNKFLGNLSSDPTSNNAEGDRYYNTADDEVKVYDGSEWKSLQLVGNLGSDVNNPATSAAALIEMVKVPMDIIGLDFQMKIVQHKDGVI